jgi:predicted ATPase/class 3 adenylate cyclase
MKNLPSGTITFLFTDVADSTRLWEKHPTEMGQALQRHDEIIESITQLHHGFVVRPRGEGDSRFLVFDRAIDGVQAAAAVQQALHEEEWPEGINLLARMAVHTGEGEFRDGDYYGPAVNRCANLRSIAHGGQTIISQAVHELVQDILPEGIELFDLGKHPIKGMVRPENIFQLMAPGLQVNFPPLDIDKKQADAPTKLPAFLDIDADEVVSQRPVFVARERELSQLHSRLEKSISGDGQVVLITGGAGRGKTALINEFCFRALQQYDDLITARGISNAHTGISDPYLPFREITRILTGDVETILSAGNIQPDHAKRLWALLPITVDALLKRGPSLVDVFVHGAALLERIETASPENVNRIRQLKELVERKKTGSSELDQTMLFEQFTNVLLILAEKYPLVLFLDDMQWADRASIDLLYHLGRQIKGHPIFIIAAYRPDEVALGRDDGRHPLENIVNELKRLFGDILIDLTKDDQEEEQNFVNLYLDSEPNRLGSEFRQTLRTHTGGHPLFIAELLRSMIDRGDLIKNNDGMWIEGPMLDWTKLPARIEAVIEERIGRLEDNLRQTLSIASVEGEEFTGQVVARVQKVQELQLLQNLSQELAKNHRLVREKVEVRIADRLLSRYRFTHHLFQRYLYNELSSGERRLLHGEIARVLEEIFAENIDDAAIQLAYHFQQASIADKSLYYFTRAGHQAKAQYANEEAIRLFSESLEFLPKDHPDRFDLLASRVEVYDLLGHREEQHFDIESMMELAEALDDEECLCDSLLARAQYFHATEHTQALEPLERAIDLSIKMKDQVREGRARHRLGHLHFAIRDFVRMRSELEIAAQCFRESGLTNELASSLSWIAHIFWFLNENISALETQEEALSLSRIAGDIRQEAICLRRLGLVNVKLDNYPEALAQVEDSLTLVRELGDRRGEGNSMLTLFGVQFWLGEHAEAERSLKQCLEMAWNIGDTYNIETATKYLFEWIFPRTGDYEESLTFIDDQNKKALLLGDEWLIANFQAFRARVLVLLGQYKDALDLEKQAITTFARLGSQFDVIALCHLGLCHTLSGNYKVARKTLKIALERAQRNNDVRCIVYSSNFLANLSLLDGNRRKMKEGVKQIERVLKNAFRGELYHKAYSFEVLAKLHLALGEIDDAYEYSVNALESMLGFDAPESKYFTHALILRKLDRDSEANEYLLRAYERVMLVAEKTKDPDLRRSWLENVSINKKIIEIAAERGIS